MIVQPGDADAMLAAQLESANEEIARHNADELKRYKQKTSDINNALQNGLNFDAAGWWPKVPTKWILGPEEPPYNYQYATKSNIPLCDPVIMWAPTPPSPSGTMVFGNIEAGGSIVGADKSDTMPSGVMLGPLPGPPDGKPHRYLKFNWVGFGSKYQVFPPE